MALMCPPCPLLREFTYVLSVHVCLLPHPSPRAEAAGGWELILISFSGHLAWHRAGMH